jgi:LysR family glycine cleavage system transcriptional activator
MRERAGGHERLGVTQGAVSRHVASLEEHMGTKLFERRGGAATLTDAGRQYFETIDDAWSTVEMATSQSRRRAFQGDRLVVRTSLPTFALTTLVPHLAEFEARSPVRVELVTSLSEPAADDEFDVLLTRDLEVASADRWEIARETLTCVASPGRAREWKERPPREWTLLSSRSRPDVLPAWARGVGLRGARDLKASVSYDHYFLAIAAGIAGLGHLVVPRLLVARHLNDGVLVTAGMPDVEGDGRYLAFLSPRSRVPAAAVDFCRWLKRLAGAGAAEGARRGRDPG